MELLEVRTLLSNLLVNGDLIPSTALALSSSQTMDAAGAQDPANDDSVRARKDHRLGTGDDRIAAIRTARYDAAASGTPLARVDTGGPGSAHAVHPTLKAHQGPMQMGLLADGGFETPKVDPHKKARTLRAGNPALAAWRIVAGSVNVQTYWPAAEGTHTLDLNGVSAGTIEQSFATTPGQVYQLAFDYGNNPDARAQTAGATVTVAGAGTLLSQSIAHSGSTPRDMKYTLFSGTFVANSATTTLQFASTTPGAYGIVLDAVAVTAQPFKFATYTLIDLGTLPGGSRSAGMAVNDSGQVTGVSDTASGQSHAFLSGPGGGPLKDLGTLPGGTDSRGFGINDSGQVAGESDTAGGAIHAFLSGPGGGPLKDLGTLPGGTFSAGYGVNASGQVTGQANTASDASHAFLSGPNGGPLKDLGTLPGGTFSHGFGVNDSGQVAGEADVAGGAIHAFLSGPGGGPLKDLGTVGGGGSSGQAVNDSGQFVGSSTTADGAIPRIPLQRRADGQP